MRLRAAPRLHLTGCSGRLFAQFGPCAQRGLATWRGTPLVYKESRVLPFSAAHVYRVISSVEHYHSFVPWCVSSTVLKRMGPQSLEAELVVGFRAFSERYVSRVALDPAGGAVAADAVGSALFSHLRNEWRVTPLAPSDAPRGAAAHSWVDFRVEFEFRSPLYGAVAGAFMDEVAKNMVAAFEARCRETAGEEAARVAEEHARTLAEAAARARAANAASARGTLAAQEARPPFSPPPALRSGLW